MADTEPYLTLLEHWGLVQLAAYEPELEYLFRHILVQEAAYTSLLKIDRQRLHQHVAETLEKIQPEHLEESYGVLAYHYQRAEVRDKAFAYLIKAAEYASQRYANETALQYYTDALALTEHYQPQRFEVLLAREKIYSLIGERQLQAQDLLALTAIAEELDKTSWRAIVALRRALYAESTGDYATATDYARQAITFAQNSANAEIEAHGYLTWGTVLWRQADLVAARTQVETALAQAQALHSIEIEAAALRQLGVIAETHGDYAGARSVLEQALNLYKQLGQRRGESMCLNSLGVTALKQDDFVQARFYYEQSLTLKREFGDRYGEGVVLNNLGITAHHLGDYVLSYGYFEACQRLCREIDDLEGVASALNGLGSSRLHLGDFERAAHYFDEALALARSIGDREGQADILGSLSQLNHLLGHNDIAGEFARQCVALAEEIDERNSLGFGLVYLGQALIDLGELDKAADAFQRSLDIRRELGQPDQAMGSLAGLAETARLREEHETALRYVGEILAYLEAHSINTVDDPFWVMLAAYRTLHEVADPRAPAVLAQARGQLQVQANMIADESLRRSFLERVPHHRALLAAQIDEQFLAQASIPEVDPNLKQKE